MRRNGNPFDPSPGTTQVHKHGRPSGTFGDLVDGNRLESHLTIHALLGHTRIEMAEVHSTSAPNLEGLAGGWDSDHCRRLQCGVWCRHM